MQLQDKFYKSTEVADILGVSLRTLYRYMETGKIQSVHLPSGRHRFTKDQIESFLFASKYMTFDSTEERPKNTVSSNNTVISNPVGSPFKSAFPETFSNPFSPIETPQVKPSPFAENSSVAFSDNVPTNSAEKNDIDDELEQLLKSLEQDEAKSFDTVKAPTPAVAPIESPQPEKEEDDLDAFLRSLENEEKEQKPQSSFTSILNEEYGMPRQNVINENEVKYYYCPFNDLKSIAKMIKKIGDNNDKQYAFTMNAGLSLFFPLDLFSMIHFYVNANDLTFFEKELELKASNKTEANLGILVTNGLAFDSVKEVSGFKVVKKERMIENLKANGLMQLASEAELRL